MSNNDLSKMSCIELAIDVLEQAFQKLDENDYVSAQVMVVLAQQILEDLQVDFDRHFQIERRLRQLLK